MLKTTILFFTLTLSLTISCFIVNAQRVTITIAGNGIADYNGDNRAARLTTLTPFDVCADHQGNIYISDAGSARIRKMDVRTGIITTIAGGGTSEAEGIPATNAALSPKYLCIDHIGNLYVSTGDKIRKVDAITGLISTIAGSTMGSGVDGDPATAVPLANPMGICIDDTGNIYIAEYGNNRIRKYNASTGILTTIAGTGVLGYSGDGGLAMLAHLYHPTTISCNSAGGIYFSDNVSMSNVIRKINMFSGAITTVAGPGTFDTTITYGTPALTTLLGSITGMCTNSSGNVYFNEISCSCRDLDIMSDTINIVGGNFYSQSYTDDTTSPYAHMNTPYGLNFDYADNLYIADYGNNRVRKLIKATHNPSFAYGRGQSIEVCSGLAISITNQLAITDADSGQVEHWTIIAAPVHGSITGFSISSNTSFGPGRLTRPSEVTYTPSASYLGMDSIKVRISDGMTSEITTIYIQVVSPPDPGKIFGDSVICKGLTYVFTGSVSEGIWSFANPIAIITPAGVRTISEGVDTLVYTVSNGACTSSVVKRIRIKECLPTGLDPLAASKINIFPNPATSTLNIESTSGQIDDMTVEITDIMGQLRSKDCTITSKPNSGKTQIDISHLPSGIYFIRINNTEIRKFTKH